MIDISVTHPSQSAVVNNLIVSGAYQTLQFEKYTTTDISPFKLIVSNSSETFGIQFFYTGSASDKIIITSASSSVTQANPIILLPKSGSNVSSVELIADVNITGLNDEPLEISQAGNQLVEGIYFNAVAIVTNSNVQISDIFEVDTISTPWRELTQRGNDALGTGYTETSRVNYIRYTKSELENKKTRLQQLKQFFDNGYGSYLSIIGKGDSLRAERQRGFKILLYSILHKLDGKVNFQQLFTKKDYWDIIGTVSGWGLPNSNPSWEGFFPWGGLSNFEGTLGSASYPAQIVNKYIKLIDDILNSLEGLSELLPPTVTTTTTPLELSRVNVKVGELDIDVTEAKYSIPEAILSASRDLIRLQTTQFFDEQREYKTILNFGDDKHYVVEAWRPVPDTASIQLKLIKPLQNGVTLYDEAYLVREFAQPVVDIINVELPPVVDDSPFLRPANTNVGKFDINKQSIKNVTLTTLGMNTGSAGVISGSTISYDDRIFNRWFTADFNSSELNLDFSDYSNFVFFGSAKARLNAFANKLQKVQTYGNSISVSSSNASERRLAIEKESIIRNFDPYEQYLYFASQSNAYSASVYYVDGGTEYNPTGSWPKDANMVPLAYTAVESWYDTQTKIAERFDEFNANYLIKHLPEHIQEDANSADFITFIQMFGHVMDNIKVYIDRFSDIYSTNPDPFKELTMDQVYEVGKSFGMDLPNAYSLESLETFVQLIGCSVHGVHTISVCSKVCHLNN